MCVQIFDKKLFWFIFLFMYNQEFDECIDKMSIV